MSTRLFLSPAMIVLFALCLLGPSFFAPPAYACSCAMPPDAQTALMHADAVFAGKVLGAREVIDWREFRPFSKPIRKQLEVTLEVHSAWKGGSTSQVQVITDLSEASCGFEFQAGQSYLVYASFGENNELGTHLCTRTAALAGAGEDLLALGQGSPPDQQIDLLSRQRLWSYGLPAAVLAVGLAAAVIASRSYAKRGRP